MDEAMIRELGRRAGRCYAPDPDSPPGQLPYRCELALGHEGEHCAYVYSWIEHGGIGHLRRVGQQTVVIHLGVDVSGHELM